MPAPQIILDLIERFERNIDDYKSGAYKETQVRREFIDPFFEALGWDVNNKTGKAENYKDVVHEDTVKVSGVTKAPDYSFRIGGQRKFFVEAKKPSVNLKDEPAAAFQIRRYAWSAKLPLSIITDFEEFAVYDCRIKPDQKDKADKARIFYYTWRQYVDKWDEIAGIFSPDAINKGSFDKFAESSRAKRGTAEVDNAFLEEIESWRETLARNIALRNTVSIRELNDAVQRIIDRIIFLRIAEDRGIEDYGVLRSICNGNNTYARLQELFEKADDRYNSGLFHFKPEKGETEPPDRLTPNLIIDDKPLKDILKRLYYPDSPYEFSVLPADILGQVYEQFLGKVIRLTSDHRAVVEDKPEVKKAGGVFYTPTYIVDYIVSNTVGKLLEGKTLKTAEKLKILDPACGSGSFLLGAYQYLLDWHLKWYCENDPDKYARAKKPILFKGHGGALHLTTSERKRILLNNIYGVDIDPQAVEVTKLSLLLKVLEDETGETLNQQRRLFHERALPSLGGNIKCGNSLIGPDFYEGKQTSFLDTEEMQRVNAFDWGKEFSEIFKAGGFDAVIGNPPYISVESTVKDVTEYYLKAYKTSYGRANTFALFLEKSFDFIKEKGLCGYIVSNRLLTNSQLAELRKFMLNNSSLKRILAFKSAVFGAAVDTAVIVFRKDNPEKNHRIEICYDIIDLVKRQYKINSISQETFHNNASYLFNIRQREDFEDITTKIYQQSTELENICDVKDGIILGGIKDLLLSNTKKDNRYEKWLEGNEVSRFSIQWSGRYICYDKTLVDEELKRKQQKAKLQAKNKSDFEKLSRSGVWLRKPDVFRQVKILTRQNARQLIGVLDDGNKFFVKNSLHCALLKDKFYNLRYILGLINSRLIDFYFQNSIGNTGEIFSQMKIAYITKLPIRIINFNNKNEKKIHDRIVELVEQMLSLNKQLAEAKTGHEQTLLQRQIDATDKQIDKLVYELYSLTPEEIAIVEDQG